MSALFNLIVPLSISVWLDILGKPTTDVDAVNVLVFKSPIDLDIVAKIFILCPW